MSSLEIIQNLVQESKYGIKCPFAMVPEGITVHNTGNDASADEEIAYMIRNDNETSFHYSVDENHTVQGLPLDRNGWHASDGNGFGNRKTIAIEIARSTSEDETLFDKAEDNAAQLIAQLCQKYGWGIDKIHTHQEFAPNHKYCPHKTLDRGWGRFMDMVKVYMNIPISSQPEPVQETPVSAPSASSNVDVEYFVKTLEDGWLPPVKNLEDFAGIKGHKIVAIAIRVSRGVIKYRVHTIAGNLLSEVTGYDIHDFMNGFAGDEENAIDAVYCYYETPEDVIAESGFKKAIARVEPLGGSDFYDWQHDDETSDNQDGYSGCIGLAIDKFQMHIG